MSYTELRSSEPIARKGYNCEWCAERITKGEKHAYRSFIWEGDFSTGRMHFECRAAMYEVPNDELEEGWNPGDYPRGKSEVPYADSLEDPTHGR